MTDKEKDRQLAEALLNRLFKDSHVNGLRFFTPQLLLDGPKDIAQDGYINLTTEWEILDHMPSEYPQNFKALTIEEEEHKLHQLRNEEVDKVQILSPWPHLVIHFKSGRVLYIHGKDEQFEPWTAGLSNHGKNSDNWLVVACPGGGLAVWAPEDWRKGNEENVL